MELNGGACDWSAGCDVKGAVNCEGLVDGCCGWGGNGEGGRCRWQAAYGDADDVARGIGVGGVAVVGSTIVVDTCSRLVLTKLIAAARIGRRVRQVAERHIVG